MPAHPPRSIVSLLPSSTEILFAIGVGERVVGVSHECDWPAQVRDLPKLTEVKIDADRSSGEIDRAIGDLLAQGEPVYRVRADLLARLKPDLIVTQDHCDICAVTTVDVQGALEDVRSTVPDYAPALLSLTPHTLADVLDDVRRVSEAAGARTEGDRLYADLLARVRQVEALAGEGAATRPRVTFLDWTDPLILSGDWIPEMIRKAGGEPQAGSGKAARVAWEEVVSYSPEILIVAPCGIALERAADETRGLASLPGWREVPAVRYGRVFAADGNALFNRPSQRIVDSLEVLADILHPNLFRGIVSDPERFYRQIDFSLE